MAHRVNSLVPWQLSLAAGAAMASGVPRVGIVFAVELVAVFLAELRLPGLAF